MWSHILVRRATTKMFADSFALEVKLERKDFPEAARTIRLQQLHQPL